MPENSADSPAAAVTPGAGPANAPQPPAKRGGTVQNSSAPEPVEFSGPTGPEVAATLHEDYVRFSLVPLTLRDTHARLWWDLYVDRGSDLDRLREDLRVVCVYLREQIARDKRNPGALRLVNLIQPDQFDSDLGEARMMLGRRAPRGPGAEKPAPAKAPPGWRAWFEEAYPLKAPEFRDRPFTDLPEFIQAECRRACQ